MVACEAPLSMGFPRQEYWNGRHFLLQVTFQIQALSLPLLQWQADSSLLSHLQRHNLLLQVSELDKEVI